MKIRCSFSSFVFVNLSSWRVDAGIGIDDTQILPARLRRRPENTILMENPIQR
jgi:hypothetical protein